MIIWVLLILFVAMVLFCSPSAKSSRAKVVLGNRYAHRGLHDAEKGCAENTLQAFSRACVHGFGIELDVRLTADGRPVVFHDDDLLRMCNDERYVDELTAEELRNIPISATGEKIPTLEEVLNLVSGRVPLLLELKSTDNAEALAKAVYDRLKNYTGEYAIESFNPKCLKWLRLNAPHVLRGQLQASFFSLLHVLNPIKAFILATLCSNYISKPDFVVYDVTKNRISPVLQRVFFRTPLVAWNVRTQEQMDKVRMRGTATIFEGFFPRN